MPEAVSLGTVYTGAELRLDGFNKNWDVLIGKIKALQEKLDGLKFDPAKINAGTQESVRGFAGLTEQIGLADKALAKLDKAQFKATGILRGADQATRALGELAEKAGFTSQRVLDLSAKSAEAQDSLRGLGRSASSTEKKIGTLAGAADAAAGSLADTGKAGLDAGAGLDALSDGAGAAKASVSGLGRAAGLTAPKLDALSLVKFDPAGIVGGADEGIGALERLRLAAQGVKDSLRMSPALTGARSEGGRRGSLAPLGGAAASGAANVAGGATVIAGIDLKNYVEYSGLNQQLAGNTNMSADDRQRMYQSGLKAMRLGGDGEGAMKSYMHIANHSYSGQEAENINDMAVKMNVATGANAELSGQVVAALMHQMGLKGTSRNVNRVGNMIHQTTASGDLNLENYNKYAAPAVGKALALGNSPADSAAFITALTQNNVRVPDAATNLKGITWQITHPTAKAQKAIDSAGLSQYYGAGKLEKYGLHEILGKSFDAVGGDQNKLMNFFNGKQGGFGAIVATSKKGAADYKSQLYDPKTGNLAALSGKLDPVDQRFTEMQKTPQQQVKRLQGEMKADSIEIGKSFVPLLTAAVPVLKMFADQVQRVIGFLGKLPLPVQEAVIGLGLFKLATVALGNPLLGLGEGVGALVKTLFGFGPAAAKAGAAAATLGEGAAAAGAATAEAGAATAEAATGLLAVAAPIAAVAAAVIAFGIAWKTNFGNIRGAFAPFLADVKQTFGGSGKAINEFIKTTLPDLKKFTSEVEPLFAAQFKLTATVIKVTFDIIKAVIKAALATIGGVIRTMLALFTGDWKGALAGIASIWQGQWAAILGLANDLSPKFVAWISHLGTAIKNGWDAALAGLKAAFARGGAELVQQFGAGLRNGIASIGPGIKAAASSVASLIPTSVRSVLDIHSPSRVMHTIGRQTSQGLADGITAGKSGVTAAMRGVVEAALKETNSKKAALLIDHQARTLRAGGMAASDVADFRESAKVALSEHGRSGRGKSKLDSERHGAGEFAATVGESPELKELHRLNAERAKGLIGAAAYAGALGRIQGNQHKKSEAEAARHQAVMNKYQKAAQSARENVQQIKDSLAALTGSPETPSLDKQEAAAKRQYRENIKKQGGTLASGDTLADGPYRPDQSAAFVLAAQLRDAQLAGIQRQRDAATDDVQGGIDAMTDKAAQDKHPYDFQRDQAEKKYGREGTEMRAGADPVKTAEALRLALKAVDDEEAKDAKETEDRKQQYLLSTQAITLGQYQAYLKTRLGDYQQYSSEWVQISGSINDIDLQLWKQQEDALKQKFDKGETDLKDYISEMKALEATLPKTASPDEKAGIDAKIASLDDKEKKASDKELVGGDDFWKNVAGDAADNGSRVLTALLHPKNSKSIYKSMWSDLMGALEGGVTGQFSKILKNLFTGQGGGFNLGSLFSGLFGHGKKGTGSPLALPATALGAAPTSFGGAIPAVQFGSGQKSLGLGGNLLAAMPLLSALPQIHGINGAAQNPALSGGAAGQGSIGSLLGMASSFIPGAGAFGALASLLPSGITSKLFTGGLFGGMLKKLFHFSKGTLSVPGHGSGDTVPAMLTPGEMVLPKAGAQLVREAMSGRGEHGAAMAGSLMRGGDMTINLAHHGDVNNVADVDQMHQDWAMQIKQQLPVTTPGT